MSAELHEARAPRRSLWPLWAIAAASIAPVVLSFAAYELWRPAATVNYGTLVATSALPDTPLHLVDGAGFRLSQLRGKWVLLMADGGGCDDYCARKLYMLRQLRLAQEIGRASCRERVSIDV
jgi:cytochrome oxidase Cu insertion factor (SCO1/SenC/PrrC family)